MSGRGLWGGHWPAYARSASTPAPMCWLCTSVMFREPSVASSFTPLCSSGRLPSKIILIPDLCHSGQASDWLYCPSFESVRLQVGSLPARAALRSPFFRGTLCPLIAVAILVKTSLIPQLRWLSAFGASAVVGATAGVLWAPASGAGTRARLAARFGGWWRAVQGSAHSLRHRLPGAGKPLPAPYSGSSLAMQPNRLLTED